MLFFSGAAGSGALARAESTRAYWLFFAARQEHEAPALLAARQRELDARAVARRMRVLGRAVELDDLAPSAEAVRRVEGTGAHVRRLSRWLNAVSVDATAAQLQALQALPDVSRVIPVARFRRSPLELGDTGSGVEPGPGPVAESRVESANPTVDYGRAKAQLDLLGAPAAHACGLTGKGVVVAVLDSGFLTSHTALQKVKVLGARDFVKNDDVVSNEQGDPASQHGHGTSCLSLIAGYDPGNFVGGAFDVSVLLAKTEDVAREVMTEEDNYVAALEWAESKGADIATSSLGYIDWWTPEDFDGMTAPTTLAVNAAVKRGLICLTATGNEGPAEKTLGVPADAFGVLSIGAVSMNGRIANFSSRGPTADGRIKPEFVAPGQAVTVARASGGYMTGDGTSYATPLAAAMVALLLQSNPELKPEEIFDILKASAVTSGPPDNVYGYGRIDIAKATANYCQCADADGDGAKSKTCGGTDCKDDDPNVHPGASEQCAGGVDENCDGLIDAADPACAGAAAGGTGGAVGGGAAGDSVQAGAGGASGMTATAGAVAPSAGTTAAGASSAGTSAAGTASAGVSGTSGAVASAAGGRSGLPSAGAVVNAVQAAGSTSYVAPANSAAPSDAEGCSVTHAGRARSSGIVYAFALVLCAVGFFRRRSSGRASP